MPTEESQDLIDLTRQICGDYLGAEGEQGGGRDVPARHLCPAGYFQACSPCRMPRSLGGGGQSYEVYLQVIEEIASAWMSVAVGVSVHSLTCFPVAGYGTDRQKADLLPAMLSGRTLGGYCLSESQAGSDVSAISTRATPSQDGSTFSVTGTKAWISHAGHADFYTAFVRTDDNPSKGLSCFVIPADTDGITFGTPERKMGLACDTVRQVHFDHAVVDSARMIGTPGQGMSIALHALDSGRLGIAAAATGLAQAALDLAASYSKERVQFGKPISEFQGLSRSCSLADMEAATTVGPGDLPARGAAQGRRQALQQAGRGGQAHLHGRSHEGHNRCRPGARWRRLHP